MIFREVNFDGLVGPTHNYAGLSLGNVASLNNAQSVSNPKEAALQGIEKMKALFDLGLGQGVLPPQQRPDIQALKRLGFSGSSDKEIIENAYKKAPHILAACSSASSMWTANAATVSPSPDTFDHRVHFTPANLCSKFHRSIEPPTTARALKAIFSDADFFAHHDPLPAGDYFSDEGAANHTRFCANYGDPGIEFFVFGRHAFDHSQKRPMKFPARQTLAASQSVARLHGLIEDQVVFAQQNPDIIDKGVFHNDVIAVGNKNVLFCHEHAFCNQQRVLDSLRLAMEKLQTNFEIVQVKTSDVSVEDAVGSYLFNSQLVTLGDNETVLIAPQECVENSAVNQYLNGLVAHGGPISEVKIQDVKQSMKNGGGPACLRLRVVLSERELGAVNSSCLFDDELYEALKGWVNKHYRDHLEERDLADPLLMEEVKIALDELTQLMNLGAIYPFQLES